MFEKKKRKIHKTGTKNVTSSAGKERRKELVRATGGSLEATSKRRRI